MVARTQGSMRATTKQPYKTGTMSMEKYDSTQDTLDHAAKVRALIDQSISELYNRAMDHDKSKLGEPELSAFNENPGLKNLEYGSPEYTQQLKKMEAAVKHHYQVNRHHPEHYDNGINGMTLVDLIEMLADWKAASERHNNGDLKASFPIQRNRFGISDQLYEILKNTALRYGWI